MTVRASLLPWSEGPHGAELEALDLYWSRNPGVAIAHDILLCADRMTEFPVLFSSLKFFGNLVKNPHPITLVYQNLANL